MIKPEKKTIVLLGLVLLLVLLSSLYGRRPAVSQETNYDQATIAFLKESAQTGVAVYNENKQTYPALTSEPADAQGLLSKLAVKNGSLFFATALPTQDKLKAGEKPTVKVKEISPQQVQYAAWSLSGEQFCVDVNHATGSEVVTEGTYQIADGSCQLPQGIR